jgi:hypothetical protein
MAEAGLLVDRVDREDVVFDEPILIRKARDEQREKAQLEIDFSKPAAGDRGGPSEMPEGFQCNYSGECPTPSKACATCEYASNGIPKSVTVSPDVAAVVAEPEIKPEGEPTLVDEINASPMMDWAMNEAGEPIEVPAELVAEGDPMNDPVIDGKIEDGPTLEEVEEWEEAVNGNESEPDEDQEAEEMPF